MATFHERAVGQLGRVRVALEVAGPEFALQLHRPHELAARKRPLYAADWLGLVLLAAGWLVVGEQRMFARVQQQIGPIHTPIGLGFISARQVELAAGRLESSALVGAVGT